MEIILYTAIAFVLGFIIAWLVKKPANASDPAVTAELNTIRTQLELSRQETRQQSTLAQQADSQLENTLNYLRAADIKVVELTTRLETRDDEIFTARGEANELKEKLNALNNELTALSRQLNKAETELRFRMEQLDINKAELEKIGSRFTQEFETLAGKVLDEKTEKFEKHQERSLSEILNPLKENIRQFKSDFEAKYSKESDDRISLREQIRHMMELNQTLSTQANNLTNALRGQVKQQGNWGEMILESILEYADLQKGIHYFPQEHTIGADGQRLYPDIIVRYPDDRSIVIDSKVSLLHYEQYCSCTDPDEQSRALQLLLGSVYKHIDGLSGKKYQEAVQSLDFVMLFVPVEGAYITIMQADRNLSQYAYSKRVLLMSPTNLIAAMKLVYDLWKKEGISRDAQEIAERAVKIYEKLASFIVEFDKIGAQIEKAGESWRDAQKKLHTGKGNLISQAMQMKKKLNHTKPVRTLPPDLEEQAMAADQEADDGDGI